MAVLLFWTKCESVIISHSRSGAAALILQIAGARRGGERRAPPVHKLSTFIALSKSTWLSCFSTLYSLCTKHLTHNASAISQDCSCCDLAWIFTGVIKRIEWWSGCGASVTRTAPPLNDKSEGSDLKTSKLLRRLRHGCSISARLQC